MTSFKDLEKKINYAFKTPSLLKEALTHSSMGRTSHKHQDYERLEFLGDRVLGLLIADWLYHRFAGEEEGVLARRHASLVCRSALVQVAKRIELDKYIHLAPGERKSGGQNKASVLADSCEAVLAALYLDGGMDVAKSFVETFWSDLIQDSHIAKKDNKSALQEWAQGKGFPAPTYKSIAQEGPEHAPIFTIEVCVDTLGCASAKGSNKQEAAQKAAGLLLQKTNKDS